MKIKIRTSIHSSNSRMTVNGQEVEDPKHKRNMHIFIMFFLGFFVAALIFALVMIINQSTNPGDFVYTAKEEIHVENASYEIRVIDRVNHPDATGFTVHFSSNGSVSIPSINVSTFERSPKNGETIYTFTVQILGENWDDVYGVSSVVMHTSEGQYKPDESSLAENIWIAYIVIGIFIVVLTTLIVFNGKWALAEHRNSKLEVESKIAATKRAVAGYHNPQTQASPIDPDAPINPNSVADPTKLQQKQESGPKIKCPYCQTENEFSTSRCKNCNAPLR